MIVCLCHRVSDHAIVSEVRAGCASFDELQESLRVATACGACTECALDTFERGRGHAPACRSAPGGHHHAFVRVHASAA
jgi:bacterioferritin-associated ferredoxin